MICRITKENLENLLLDRESVPVEVRKHVNDCPDCKQELTALEATMQALDAWEAPEPSPFFETRMAARLRSEREAAPAGFFERLRARLLYGTNMHLRPVAVGASGSASADRRGDVCRLYERFEPAGEPVRDGSRSAVSRRQLAGFSAIEYARSAGRRF